MARPLTPDQRRENAAFLTALRRSGNVRLAARECGLGHSTMQGRRAAHPAFALGWAAALVVAEAGLRRTGPLRPATGNGGGPSKEAGYRTRGGEPVVLLLKTGRLQLRRAQPGKVTAAAEQAFLLAVSATANIALAAASVGVAQAAFHRRKRRNPAFARELRVALATGYARLEMALLEGWMPDSGDDTGWRTNEPPAIPPMTPAQALQLMYLHRRSAEVPVAKMDARLLPGETGERRSLRLARLYRAGLAARTEDEVAAAVLSEGGRVAPVAIALPDLAQVTGWSKADPAKGGPTGTWGNAALFGGWRMENLTPEQREAGRKKGQGRRKKK